MKRFSCETGNALSLRHSPCDSDGQTAGLGWDMLLIPTKLNLTKPLILGRASHSYVTSGSTIAAADEGRRHFSMG